MKQQTTNNKQQTIKTKKGILSLSLAVMTGLASMQTTSVYAMDSCMGLSTQSVEAKAYATSASAIMNFEEEELDLMSCDELENYIGELHTLSKTTIKSKKGYTPAQQAWLVAAAIAKKKGYPCVAICIKHSVKNIPVVETPQSKGVFRKRIVKTTAYKNYKKKYGKQASASSSIAFEKSMNKDLYYSLHNVNIRSTGNKVAKKWYHTVMITDTFDFAYDNTYKSLFTSIVNNAGWLFQNTGALHPIGITISFID